MTIERRYAVIGDVAGHYADLTQELRRLGADPEAGTLPPDLIVVQVGDLIHRGPQSDAVVALVDHFIRTAPQQWIQLIGNHEAHYARAQVFEWHEQISARAISAVRAWWHEGIMQVATVVPSATGDLLVTHAGVTEPFWREDLGALPDPYAVAERLNQMGRLGRKAVFRPGEMLTDRVAPRVGPLWASAGSELVASWVGHRLPFGQVHGHSSCYDWQRSAWRPSVPSGAHIHLDHDAGHETVTLDGGVIIGVDPGHGARAHTAWRAWVSQGTSASRG